MEITEDCFLKLSCSTECKSGCILMLVLVMLHVWSMSMENSNFLVLCTAHCIHRPLRCCHSSLHSPSLCAPSNKSNDVFANSLPSCLSKRAAAQPMACSNTRLLLYTVLTVYNKSQLIRKHLNLNCMPAGHYYCLRIFKL